MSFVGILVPPSAQTVPAFVDVPSVPIRVRVGGYLELSLYLRATVVSNVLVLDLPLVARVSGSTSRGAVDTPEIPWDGGGSIGGRDEGQLNETGRASAFMTSATSSGLAAPVLSFRVAGSRTAPARASATVLGDVYADPMAVALFEVSQGRDRVNLGPYDGIGEARRSRENSSGWRSDWNGEESSATAVTLPELVPWEMRPTTEEEVIAARNEETARAAAIAAMPAAMRDEARRDKRYLEVDEVVMSALSRIPYSLAAPAPFPGYRFRADGGPSYSTLGKTPLEVMTDIWGRVGYSYHMHDGVAFIRGPAQADVDLVLPLPVLSESWESLALQYPESVAVTGHPRSLKLDPTDTSGGGTDGDSPDPGVRAGGQDGAATSDAPKLIAAHSDAVLLALSPGNWRVERRDAGGADWSVRFVGTGGQYEDRAVTPTAHYEYRAIYTVAGKIQTPSAPLAVEVPETPEYAPNPPVAFHVERRTSTQLLLRWQPGGIDGPETGTLRHGAPTGYTVSYLDKAGVIQSVDTNAPGVTISGLDPGQTLELSLRAKNAQGQSSEALLEASTIGLPPAAPDGLKIEDEDLQADSLVLRFADADGAESYMVEYGLPKPGKDAESVGNWISAAERAAPPQPAEAKPGDAKRDPPGLILFPVEGLSPETRYAIRVRGRNSFGLGAPSEALLVTTTSRPPAEVPDMGLLLFDVRGDIIMTTRRASGTEDSRTTITKLGGHVVREQTRTEGLVPIPTEDGGQRRIWVLLTSSVTRYFYDLDGWPDALTGTVRESISYSNEATRTDYGDQVVESVGGETGRETERVFNEWSAEGWLRRRTTTKETMSYVSQSADIPATRSYQNLRTTTIEEHLPVGRGLWFHSTRTVSQTYRPVLDASTGRWSNLAIAFSGGDNITGVDDKSPEQLSAPARAKDGKPAPKIPDPADQLGPDEFQDGGDPGDKWFDHSDPGYPEGVTDRPRDNASGSGDTSGKPEPEIRAPETVEIENTLTVTTDGRGPAITLDLPWVEKQAAMREYVMMLLATLSRRHRVSRTYLGVAPVSLSGPVTDYSIEYTGGETPSGRTSVTTEFRA